jgi:hypothetical protein
MTAAPSLITAGECDAGRRLMARLSLGGEGEPVSRPNSCPAAVAVHHHGHRRRVQAAFTANSGSHAYGGETGRISVPAVLVVDSPPALDVNLSTSSIPATRAQHSGER